MPLAAELIEEIKKRGAITVAEYMQRCNAHYYGTRDPLGTQGDFTTAPEMSQIFGELVGGWLADEWQRLGAPRAVLCELGPGRGTLMKDILRATKNVAGFHGALDIVLVETSPVLRRLQEKTLHEAHPRIRWRETSGDFPPQPLFLIANEFFDALPVRQFMRVKLEETERRITYDGARFLWQPEGVVTREDSPLSAAILRSIAVHIHGFGGAALIADYGYVQGEQGETLQAVARQRYCDPLAYPGEADLTAHVDFLFLAQVAKNTGACVHGPVEQGLFLKRLGAELRATALCRASASPEQREAILSGLERIVSPHEMGALFKVMAITQTLDKPAGFDRT